MKRLSEIQKTNQATEEEGAVLEKYFGPDVLGPTVEVDEDEEVLEG